MRISINSKCMLANALLNSSKPINLFYLSKLKEKLYKKLKNQVVYIDVSKDSILSAVYSNPKLFKYVGDKIDKADNSFQYYQEDYINNFINYKIPKDIKSIFLKVFLKKIK